MTRITGLVIEGAGVRGLVWDSRARSVIALSEAPVVAGSPSGAVREALERLPRSSRTMIGVGPSLSDIRRVSTPPDLSRYQVQMLIAQNLTEFFPIEPRSHILTSVWPTCEHQFWAAAVHRSVIEAITDLGFPDSVVVVPSVLALAAFVGIPEFTWVSGALSTTVRQADGSLIEIRRRRASADDQSVIFPSGQGGLQLDEPVDPGWLDVLAVARTSGTLPQVASLRTLHLGRPSKPRGFSLVLAASLIGVVGLGVSPLRYQTAASAARSEIAAISPDAWTTADSIRRQAGRVRAFDHLAASFSATASSVGPILTGLASSLPADAAVERVNIDGENVQVTVVCQNFEDVLRALVSHRDFSEVVPVGEVRQEPSGGMSHQVASVRFRFVRRRGEGQ